MKTFYLLVTLLGFLLLQAILAPRIALGAISPDFVTLLVVFFALYRGPISGAILGFAIGFLQDLGVPEMLGLNAMVGAAMGFLVGHAGQKTFPEHAAFLFGLFFIAVLGRDVVYLLVYHWPRVDSAFVRIFMEGLPSAVYTALFGVLVDRIVALFGARVVSIGKEGQ